MNAVNYKPGLHILCTFSAGTDSLKNMSLCQSVFNNIINNLGLVKVGEVYHQFPEGGYTAVVGLTESHVSIHTWPEFGIATFDVFLSSFKQDNSTKVRTFFELVIAELNGTVLTLQEIAR